MQRNYRITLRDTDSTGVIYFSEQLRVCVETFEFFCHENGLDIHKPSQFSEYLLPIVHIESDFFSPLKWGDDIELKLTLKEVGNSSFTLYYEIIKDKSVVGTVTVVHVAVLNATGKSHPLPSELEELLLTLPQFEEG